MNFGRNRSAEDSTEEADDEWGEVSSIRMRQEVIKEVNAQRQPAEVGTRAPNFGVRPKDGRHTDLAQLEGKVVLIDFWASWCEASRHSMPAYEALYRGYRQLGLVVIGVSLDKHQVSVDLFQERTPVSFPIAGDHSSDVVSRFRPWAIPSTYLIDRRGIIRHINIGYREGDDRRIENEVKHLLTEQPHQ